jgi:antitoxin component of MazEF toxin-antitoxin module
MTTVKALKVGNSLMLCVPRWFTTSLKIQRGDVLAVELAGSKLQYTPIRPHMLVGSVSKKPRKPKVDDTEERGQ